MTVSLAERILDCFPSGTYALVALLRLLDVVETDEVPTAAVECRAQPRLLVNPAFVAEWAPTPEKLLMLVMHELHHVLLGHCRLFPRVTWVDNLAFDAVINALLCRMFPEPEHVRFFTDYYRDDHFPDCLLRPVAGWPAPAAPELPPALLAPELREVGDVYRALYSAKGASYGDLYGALANLLNEALAAAVPLLGDHRPGGGSSSGGELEARSPVLFDAVRQIVERWPQPPDPIAGRSLADLLLDEAVRPKVRPTNRATLRRLFRLVGSCEGEDGVRRAWKEGPSPVETPLPTFDRRSVVLRALGAQPLLHAGSVSRRQRRPAGEKVHVYLDVSGSIGNLKGALYGAVLDCRAFVHPVAHLFSTAVVDVSLADLRRGRCETTGGTSIDCVAEHLRAHAVRRAVLITDGFVGPPAGEHRETLSKARLGVALTPGMASRDDLKDVTDYWGQLGGGM